MKNNNQEEKRITFDEVLQMPELAHFHEVIRYVQTTPFKDIFPKKYEMGIEYMTSNSIRSLFHEHPNMSIKSVVSIIVNDLPEDISPQLLLKMTKFTLEKWKKLKTQALEKTNDLQVA